MRIVVTGGAGFIGSSVVESLAAHDHEVYVVDDLSTGHISKLDEVRKRGEIAFHRFDIRSATLTELFEQMRPEVVVNLAAQPSVPTSVADPVFDADVNIIGLIRVLEASVACGARKVIQTSSGGTIYGSQKKYPVRETATGRPESPYGITKRAGEDYLRFYREERGVDFTSLALANVYGPRQDPHGEAGVIAIFANALVAGRAPRIDGTGDQTRDFIFVEDVADAFAKACDAGSGETINVGTGIETTINELYKLMSEVAGYTGEPERGPARHGDLMRNSLDPSKAQKVLGWKPWTSLSDGVRATYEWFQQNAG